MSKKRVFDYNNQTKTNALVSLIMRGLFGLGSLIPYNQRNAAAGWFSRVVLGPLGGMNKRIEENLAYVRPDISAAEIKKIRRISSDNLGRVTMESLSTLGFIKYAKRANMTGPGLGELESALSSGRPVLLVSAHFGNCQVIRVLLREMGRDVAAIYRPFNNGYSENLYITNLNRIATPNYSIGMSGTKKFVGYLRSGGAASMLIDQHANRGVPLEFMGKPAWTAISAGEMALKYDALLVPCFVIRKEDGLNFEAIIEKPIAHSNAKEMIQEFNDVLEKIIWAHPGQWFWAHRRWKRK